MRLIKSCYEILTSIKGEEILKSIEKAARTCYKSEDKISEDDSSARELVQKLLNRNHEAMIEFGPDITVKFVCDRGVSHELVRHRMASFAQESTRYCNYGKDEHITFIIPCWVSLEEGIYKYNSDESSLLVNDKLKFIPIGSSEEFKGNRGLKNWISTMIDSEKRYNILISDDWAPQQARSVLPNSLKTEINLKANLREWRHIFKLRTAKAAHPQMRELMCPLLDELKTKIPLIFDDIKY